MGGHSELAAAIRSAAAVQNLNRSEIGLLMGLSHTTVGEWFSGKRAPSRQQLIELEELLHVEPGSLCVLGDYLPEGQDPKVERRPGEVVVRLSTSPAIAMVAATALVDRPALALALVPIIHVPDGDVQEMPAERRYLLEAA